MTITARSIATPIGEMLALMNEEGALVALPFADDSPLDILAPRAAGTGAVIQWDANSGQNVARQLAEYFDGKRRTFELKLQPRGSAFQREVWYALARIPYGTTLSYTDLGRSIGRPGAARAVGRANATNPIPIVVPCHRVIGSSGALTGYGGGMSRKEFLLTHEGALSGTMVLAGMK
jgi:methylated-DNA-[protein]-cysteine S-methyltransferase